MKAYVKVSAALTFVLAGCAAPVSSVSPNTVESATVSTPAVMPPKCPGQKTSKEYATAGATLKSKGGSVCFPEFHKFGGSLPYSPPHPPVKVEATTSTTNYNGKLPNLGTGEALLYEQLRFASTVRFHSEKAGNVTFEGNFTPGDSYTFFAEFEIGKKTKVLTPCFAIASQNNYGGAIDVGPGLQYGKVKAGTVLVIEIYAGDESDNKC